MAGAVVTVLVSVGVYGLVLAPRVEHQTLEIEGMRQEALVLQNENEGLEQKIDELERNLDRMKLHQEVAPPPPPTQKRPRRRFEKKRTPERDALRKPGCDENDPLCGI